MIDLMLCCNSGRNGLFMNLCRQIEIPGLRLESPYVDAALHLEILAGLFQLGRSRKFPHHGHSTWVGNWSWDSLRVSEETAARVVNFAIENGYLPDDVIEDFWDAIDNNRPITADEIRAACLPTRKDQPR